MVHQSRSLAAPRSTVPVRDTGRRGVTSGARRLTYLIESGANRPVPVDSGLRVTLPAAIASAGEHAARRFIEFFAATIRNANTREAYARAVRDFFAWCDARGVRELRAIEPIVVAAHVEALGREHSRPTVKQRLAAVRMLFDWLVTGGVLAHNPAASVRGPKHSVKRGKTPVLDAEQARRLLDSIPLIRPNGEPDFAGLRDRALIAVMLYSFARVSAAVGMRVGDYYPEGKRWWLRLREKGGKEHQVPAHHNAEAYLDAWLAARKQQEAGEGAGLDARSPLFPTIGRDRCAAATPMTRNDALRMVKRRVRAAGAEGDDEGVPLATCCHTFRATGITVYLENHGTIENAQAIAAHESPRTTKLYDRTSNEITLDEIQRIRI